MNELLLISDLKKMIREDNMPYFSDEELAYYLKRNNNDLNMTAHECLILKSQDTTLNISGLTTNDTSKYFLRLAARYRPNNSGILKG